MKLLRGKNALVTGGSRGVGPHIGRALAAEGVNVALTARSAEQLEASAHELAGLGVRAVAIPADVADEASRQRLVERARTELGQIDILVNNAGIVETIAFAAQTYAEMVRIIEVNLMAPIALARMLLPGMLERRQGHIATVASLSGKKGVPYEAAYCATKAGLIQWSTAVRLELEGTGVGVSVICPSYIVDSGMLADLGRTAPRLVGAVRARDVAQAVVRAIRCDAQELLATTLPARPLLALDALSPALGNLILKGTGAVALGRQIAAAGNARRQPMPLGG